MRWNIWLCCQTSRELHSKDHGTFRPALTKNLGNNGIAVKHRGLRQMRAGAACRRAFESVNVREVVRNERAVRTSVCEVGNFVRIAIEALE